MIARFRGEGAPGEVHGERVGESGPIWYVARPIQIKNPQCLACHSTPEAAPATLIKTYGSAGGFGWNLNEIVGAQVVTVPMAVPLKQAREAFLTFAGTMAAIFLITLITLNLMLDRLIVRPVAAVARATNDLSLGKFGEAELNEAGDDEVAELRRAFNRMRRSMMAAIALAKKAR